MIKAVIFDKDGVLIDSEYTNVKAAVLSFEEFGINLTQEERDWVVGRHPDDYSVPFLKKYSFNYEKFREIQRGNYQKVLASTPLFDTTIDLLKEIHSKGIPVALCTSASKKSTLEFLGDIGIKELFQEIVTNTDYIKRKPDPEPYLVTAEKLGLDPADCLVIEDSGVGLRSAISAGMKCIVIYNEYTKNHDFSGAELVVDSADKIDIDRFIQ